MEKVLTHEHLGITMYERSKKPRVRGLTMVIDQGAPWEFEDGLLEEWGDYVDVVKLTIRHLLQPLDVLKKKIEMLRRYNIEVQPGGIIVELARFQGRGEECLRRMKDLGFTQVEVSPTTGGKRVMDEDAAFTELAKKLGYTVFGEIGRKMLEGDSTRIDAETLNVKESISQIKRFFDAGADKVYIEGHVLRRILGETASEILKKQATGTPQLLEIVDAIGQDRLVFECSAMCPRRTRRAMHFWFVYLFGPDVNIGNVRLEEVGTLEPVRRGLYPTFGFGPAGDHPWIRSVSHHNGAATEKWWREFPLEGIYDPLSS